nr:receptor-like protein 15 [Populus alba]
MVWSLLWVFGGREIGLLEIQALIDPYGFYLRDWVDSSNCCLLKNCKVLNWNFTGLLVAWENEGFEILHHYFDCFEINCIGWCELKNLKQLDLSGNNFGGSLPDCLGNLSSLQLLDVSKNQFTGNIASSPLTNLISLKFLSLSNNLFEVSTSMKPFMNHSSLKFFSKYLYLGGNNFWGQISDFSLYGGKAWIILDLSNNQFSGMLPRWFVNSTHLSAIDMSKNHFRGSIPRDFCKLDQLEYLDLSKNSLSGYIPSCFNPPSLTHLHLSKNRLSGPLTYGFYNNSSLVTMDLRDNSFIGSIPNWIGNLSSLSVLLLRANHFDGELRIQLCLLEQLSILDVSQNQLSGPLPSCLGNLTFKESSQKTFTNLTMYFPSLSVYKAYDENNGYTTGGKFLSYMSGIDLSNNNFIGAIPPEFGNLIWIFLNNNLNGAIPPQLTEVTTLEVFSVAHNNLSGRTPERKYQFGTFDESCYEENPFLCGPPLQNNCSKEAVLSQPVPNDEQGDDGFIDMEFFYISFGVCYTVVVMTIAAVLYINPYWRRRWLYFIEDCIDACYYFVVASFRKFSNFRR